MASRFQRHYTPDEARALLPEVRRWLEDLKETQRRLANEDNAMSGLLASGLDLGGDLVNGWVRLMAGLKSGLMEFHKREIQLKDLERGLIDFPALRDGKEVFLCWESEEDDICYWHDLDAGYAGRSPL